MTPHTRWRISLPTTLALALGILAACSGPDSSMVGVGQTRTPSLGPSFWVGGPAELGAVQVCNYGPAGTYGFSVDERGGSGTFPLGTSFTLTDGACEVVWRTTSTDRDSVRVTMTSTPASVNTDSVVGFTTENTTPQVTVTGATLVFNFVVNSQHSGSARFYSSSTNPLPRPSRITVCKNGPPGTYSFTADAVRGTLLLGTSFTLDAGECKDVWEATAPTSDPEPLFSVHVTEVNLSTLLTLDSIIADTTSAGMGPVVVTNPTIEFEVNYFHGGRATFYNSQVPADCGGLTPGFWKNWRNQYTAAQFELLLAGTIAPTIAQADAIFNKFPKTSSDPLTKLKWFVLANQLTFNLTTLNAAGADLPNPSAGNLIGSCTATPGGSELGSTLTIALQIIADPTAYTSAYILSIKDILDAIANLGGG